MSKLNIFNLLAEEFEPSGRVIREDLSDGRALHPIPVVNDIDDEDVEAHYQYIEHNVDDQDIPEEDMTGCKCVGKCEPATCQCIRKSTIKLYEDGRVKNAASLHTQFYSAMLYECDEDICQCRANCNHRMTPPRFSLFVELFKTHYAGFGVRSRQYIPAGTFIAEFVGELLSFKEAYIRQNPEDYAYQVINQHSKDGHYVDPKRYGNISRFFNHSCFENCLPIQYFSSHRHKKRASVGFVAFRDILPGDELTIDYGTAWWERIVKMPKYFFCCCDWVYCVHPAPDKHQVSVEEATRKTIQICREKHAKLRKYLEKKVRLVKR